MARKTNVKAMSTRLEDFCTSFHNAIRLERGITGTQLNNVVTDVEMSLLNKELNSHKFNAAVEPPHVFSTIPVITSPQKLAEVLKVFPRYSKFSGTNKDGNMSVVEFLNSLKAAQQQCNLSEPEFLERILAASTGPAHDLILEWKSSGMDTSAIFHNLLLNYDKRITAEDARSQLVGFKANKGQDLADVEAHIIKLIGRAATALPAGETRTAYYNLEGCNALIRSLPPASSQTASNLFNSITARLGRSCTLHELSQGLNLYRNNIDKDIKSSGTDYTKNYRKGAKYNNSYSLMNRKYTSYNVDTGARIPVKNEVSYTPRPRQMNSRSTFNTRTPNTNSNNRLRSINNSNNTRVGNRNNTRGSFNSNRRPQYNNNNTARDKCSLCGWYKHKATDCKNMVDNSGQVVGVIPTMGFCSKCPSFVKDRLRHPDYLCPFRNNGPFDKKNKTKN